MNLSESKKQTKATPTFSIWRPILTGASIGLYFGWFFRPVREPNFFIAIFLSLLISSLLTAWTIFRRKQYEQTIGQIVRNFPLLVLKYALVLAVLEARHFAFDWGGRAAVIALTMLMGALFGLWFFKMSNRSESVK